MKQGYSIREALDAVTSGGAIAIYWDWMATYLGTLYIIETPEELAKFQKLPALLWNNPDEHPAYEELRRSFGLNSPPRYLTPLYIDGEWRGDPHQLLQKQEEYYQSLR